MNDPSSGIFLCVPSYYYYYYYYYMYSDRWYSKCLHYFSLSSFLCFVSEQKIKDIRPHLRCFCSGPSGTCVLKTCSYVETKRMLTRTADALYQQYQKFVNGGTAAVESARALIAEAQVQPRPATVATHRNMSVIATRHSPNYCRRNSNWGLLGPRGRSCREACGENVEYFTGSPACNEICCGRLHTHVTEYQCDCKLEDWDLRCKICSRAVTVCA